MIDEERRYQDQGKAKTEEQIQTARPTGSFPTRSAAERPPLKNRRMRARLDTSTYSTLTGRRDDPRPSFLEHFRAITLC